MPKVIMGVKVYNLKEAAEQLDVSYATIKNYHAAGRIQGQRIGRSIMVSEDELRRFVEGRNGARGQGATHES
jgi:excisionase family DNA binding protein